MSQDAAIRRWDITIIKMMVVVIALGSVMGMAAKLFGQSRDSIQRMTFASNLRTYAGAARLYRFKNAQMLPAARSGAIPRGFQPFVDGESWIAGTPIGGAWSVIHREYGVKSAIGVHFNRPGETRDHDYMTEVDRQVDDGDLATGSFRKLDQGRYYFILVE